MRTIRLSNFQLIYTEIPNNATKIANLREMHERGISKIDSIYVVDFPGNGLCLSHDQKYAIVDGNHRAYDATTRGKKVLADVVETDEDVLFIMKKLDQQHSLIRDRCTIKTLGQLIDAVDIHLRTIIEIQPLTYR